MKPNIDTVLRKIFKNYTQQPSADCWDKIAGKLDAINVANQTANNASSAGSSASSATSISIAAKVGIVAASLTVASVIGVIVWLNNTQQAENQSIINTPTEFLQQEEIIANSDTSVINNDKENNVNTLTDKQITSQIPDVPILTDNKNVPLPLDNQSIDTNKQPVVTPVAHPKEPQSTSTSVTHTTPTVSKVLIFTQTPPAEETIKPTSLASEEAERPAQPDLSIPNIFTPNGDGINDAFEINGIEQVPENELNVFTREGKVIFKSVNYHNQWTADNVPNGVYFYIFKFTYQQSTFMRRGSITVRR
ncbi:MAG: gliding motility-associated C-terminal domain-containing protein [Bacteroidales bacterium]|jgi:gliding motility-associated-like protein|nr:gliding motility-associated C-terminal domain-containing protein [Bacteroidales bacterium]